jgi:ferredoxin
MLQILEDMTSGHGRPDDVALLEELGQSVKLGSLCGLGQTAPNPVLSTIRYFRHEYTEHLAGACPARKCRSLVTYQILDTCIGCTKCARNCPSNAIAPRPREQHVIDTSLCVRCDLCRHVCPVGAVVVVPGRIESGPRPAAPEPPADSQGAAAHE